MCKHTEQKSWLSDGWQTTGGAKKGQMDTPRSTTYYTEN